MRALTDQTGVVDINLFTAIEYDRIKALYADGTGLSEARDWARSELLSAFGFSTESDNAELLLVSSLMSYTYNNIASLQSAITSMRVDFADGTIDVSGLTKNARYIDAETVRLNLQNYFDSKSLDVVVDDFFPQLWSMYGSDTLIPGENNYLSLEAEDPIELVGGYGHLDTFIVPENHTLTFTINLPVENNYVRFFETQDAPSFSVTDCKIATVTGPGYFRLDFMAGRPDTPYEFTVSVNNNGVTDTVTYIIVSE
jgi:hypothetical protein